MLESSRKRFEKSLLGAKEAYMEPFAKENSRLEKL